MIVSLFTCALSFFSLITLTLAWFAMNKNTGAGGMDVVVRNDSIVAECEYFVADASPSGTGYSFVKATSEDKNKLGTYDVLNDKYQFLIRIKLVSAMNVKITADTATDFFLGSASAKTDGHLLKADGSGNALSSVVSFKVFAHDELTADGSGYKLSALPADRDMVCFFDRTKLEEASRPVSSLDLVSGGTGTETFEVTADGSGGAYLFIMLSYDPLLTATVFSANIGNEEIEQKDDAVIPFELDFSISVLPA